MIKVRGYDVYFQHRPTETGVITTDTSHGFLVTPYKGFTVCVIEENKELVSSATAFCGMEDTYNKSAGRKISLGRAIAKFDKQLRKEIWEAYIKEVGRL